MTAWCVVCERSRENMGRRRNKTYANVLKETRRLDGVNSVNEWLTNNPNHQWSDPASDEFIIEVTETQYNEINDGTNPLTHDGYTNEPRWQQQTDTSGAAQDFGSWEDPESKASTWRPDIEIPDDRWIGEVYDNDPSTTGVHVAVEEFDEDTTTPTRTRYFKLYNSDGTPSTTNAQNQRTEIGGYMMDFDFTNGVAPFNIAVDRVGKIVWNSDEQYRLRGPNGEKDYCVNIYGKTLRVPIG